MTQTDIFCDGSARGNGQQGARAGYGVILFIDRLPSTKYSVKLPASDPQTNQRAELLALFHALRIVKEKHVQTTIYTDSMYGINCVSVWGSGWKKRGWKKADGKPVLHVDIIEPMITLYESLTASKFLTLKHVKGHQKTCTYEAYGNSLADELATAAADS
jgi:ribonuclease HI